jgi:hypothetical protein
MLRKEKIDMKNLQKGGAGSAGMWRLETRHVSSLK